MSFLYILAIFTTFWAIWLAGRSGQPRNGEEEDLAAIREKQEELEKETHQCLLKVEKHNIY